MQANRIPRKVRGREKRARRTYRRDRENRWADQDVCDPDTGKALEWRRYQSCYIEQYGGCNACGRMLKLYGAVYHTSGCADHCHSTGYFRQILCQECNLHEGRASFALGWHTGLLYDMYDS